MLLNRNALLAGGLRPHNYCLPVLKRERHRAAVLAAAVSGNSRFFLGTDSAPHPRGAKESACGCAGIFSAPVAMPLYAHAFEQAGALDKARAGDGRGVRDAQPGTASQGLAQPSVNSVNMGCLIIFDSHTLLAPCSQLEGFSSFHGADFYRLPRNRDTVTLVKRPQQVPAEYAFGDAVVVPMWAGETLQWSVE